MKKLFFAFIVVLMLMTLCTAGFSETAEQKTAAPKDDNETAEQLIQSIVSLMYPNITVIGHAPVGEEGTENIVIGKDSWNQLSVMIVCTDQPDAQIAFCNTDILEDIHIPDGGRLNDFGLDITDKWNDGNPYVWYVDPEQENHFFYIVFSEDSLGQWFVKKAQFGDEWNDFYWFEYNEADRMIHVYLTGNELLTIPDGYFERTAGTFEPEKARKVLQDAINTYQTSDQWYIKHIEPYYDRVKLRSKPSKGGEVLGQYYGGTEVTLISNEGEWAEIDIYGNHGYMMTQFLTKDKEAAGYKTTGLVWPFNDNDFIYLYDEKGNEIRKIGHENVYVLGAKDADTLHVLTMDAEGSVSGYIALDAVSWTDNLRSARVNADKPSDTVKLREEPSTSSDVLCRLYTGTSVNLMFDWLTVGNEWSKVRVGSVTGYMMNRYLDYSSGGTSRYIPRPALITAQEAPVTGSAAVVSVDQNTPLYILGIKGSGKDALYLCEGSTWITEQKYKSFYGWIQAGYLPYDSKNPCTAVSHIARLNKETPVYQIRGGKAERRAGTEGIPDSFAEGTEILILGGLDSELGSVTENNYCSEYLTEDTVWVMVSVEIEKYHFLECILPIDTLDYDQGLMLPWQFTNG